MPPLILADYFAASHDAEYAAAAFRAYFATSASR